MKNCTFCNLEKEEVILETEHCYVVLDKYPVAEGHLLVIPKEHFGSLIDILDEIFLDILRTIKEMEKRMIEKMQVKGIDLLQHYRPFLKEGKLVKRHIHFHLIPRSFNDPIYQKKGSMDRKTLSKPDRENLTKLLAE